MEPKTVTKLRLRTHPSRTSDSAYLLAEECEHEITLMEVLGEGCCSLIYRVGDSSLALSNGSFAAKVMKKPSGEASQLATDGTESVATTTTTRTTTTAVREVEILELVAGSKHVVAIQGLYLASIMAHSDHTTARLSNEHVELILMERFEFSFHDELMRTGPSNEERASEVMTSVFAALAHIHSRGVVHRDVRAQNIFISANDRRAVLSNFGMAVQVGIDQGIHWKYGTPGCIAPEAIRKGINSSKIDMFAAGVLLLFAVTQTMPLNNHNLLQQTLDYCPDLGGSGGSGGLAGNSNRCIQLIQVLLERDPDLRISAERAVGLCSGWLDSVSVKDRRMPLWQRLATRRESQPLPAKAELQPKSGTFAGFLARAQKMVATSATEMRLRMRAVRCLVQPRSTTKVSTMQASGVFSLGMSRSTLLEDEG
mmetsp:Transcript_82238/g.148398  ORF Transcript_82238/g.148398 Transcript_82238/m.148398 type:complete len:425 (-) Transcript_82238:44-1318(-)